MLPLYTPIYLSSVFLIASFLQTDEFLVEACWIGDLSKVRIGLDGSNEEDAWFLQNLIIWEQDKPKNKWEFPFHKWFSLDKVCFLLPTYLLFMQ